MPAAHGAPPPSPGGDPDGGEGDDEDEDPDENNNGWINNHGGNPQERGWIIEKCFRDTGDDFYHWRLRDLLLCHYGFGKHSIQYECKYHYHLWHPSYWTAKIHIGRPSPYLRALRVMSTHGALASHSTQLTAITDAARLAYFAYRDYFWATINEDEDRYYPRRRRGQIAVRMTPIMGVDNQMMAATNEVVANLHTELNAALLELQQVHH